ncbi:MAG: hypothetical protein OEV78_06310 [Spirochaetia bacterium]|nr:hypothetical protein [Spirochaetia bacterium]
MSVKLIDFGLENKKLIKKFVKFHWTHYKGDNHFIPQLNGELLGNKLFSMKGVLTPEHPLHQHVEVHHWLAYKNGKIAGRIAGGINRRFNEFHNIKSASFSFFESIDDQEVADELFQAVAKWAKNKGMEDLRGPGGQYSNATHEPWQGCLIDNFHDDPCLEMPYHKFYYASLMEKHGFRKIKDYYAIQMSKHHPFTESEGVFMNRLKKRSNVQTRAMDKNNIKGDVLKIIEIYNESWKNNWGFLPVTKEEGEAMAEMLTMIAVPELIRFAMVDGKEVAMIGFLPDLNETFALKKSIFGNSDLVRLLRMFSNRKKIKRYRFMFLGVMPEYKKRGFDGILSFEVRTNLDIVRPAADRVEASLLLEDNIPIIQLATDRGMGHIYKTYRIYSKEL